MRLNNLQIRAPVCCCEEPPPGPTSRRCRPCPSNTRWLGVWGRRVTGHPTSASWCNVWATAQLSDQRGGSLLLVIVVGDPHELTMLQGLAGLRWQCFCRRWIHNYWPFPRHPILGGRGRTVLFLLTAGVLRTPSSITLWRVHPHRILHTRCQRYVHCAPVNVSNLQ